MKGMVIIMDNYSGWDNYYRSNSADSIWKAEAEEFLVENLEYISDSESGLKVLDVACGDGRNTKVFCQQQNSICCVDISETALIKLKNKLNTPICVCGDFAKINFVGDQFDIAICFDGLPQMENPKFVIEKLYKSLRVGGYLLFNFFTPNDCAYGEGTQVDENTFNYQDTLFKFLNSEDVLPLLPKNANIIKQDVRKWNDPPHGKFRPYPHTHEACFFLLQK